jgi:hypothetical protein
MVNGTNSAGFHLKGKPMEPTETNHPEQQVTIAYFSNSAEAGMACELLVNNGVNAILTGMHFGALDPLPLPGGFSEIRLIVPAEEAERAKELYDAFFSLDETLSPEGDHDGGQDD